MATTTRTAGKTATKTAARTGTRAATASPTTRSTTKTTTRSTARKSPTRAAAAKPATRTTATKRATRSTATRSGTRSTTVKTGTRTTATRATARGGKTPDVMLRQLAEGNGDALGTLLELQIRNVENSGLDPKTHAMVRLAALVTEDAAPASYAFELPIAAASGVTREDVTGLLVALAPTVGAARIVQGAGNIAKGLAIDYAAAQPAKRGRGKMK